MTTTKSVGFTMATGLFLLASLVPGSALGGDSYPQDYSASIDIYAGGLDSLDGGGSFSTSVSPPNGSFLIPGSSIAGSDSATGSEVGFLLSGSADFDNTEGIASSSGGVVPLSGQLFITFLIDDFDDFGPIAVPLSFLGGGGTGLFTQPGAPKGETWQFRVDGAEWQDGVVQPVFRVNGATTAVQGTFDGADDRTEMGAGNLRLIAPMRVLAIRNKTTVEVPITGQLEIPEPGLLALQISAAGLLAAMGWNRRKKN